MKMAILNIMTEGDEVLRKKCKPVTEITPKILTLLDDMKDTLKKAEGVGLAAPQVGILRRIFIIDIGIEEGRNEFLEFINPEIIKTEGEQDGVEGCLSVPGKKGEVVRPMTVTVKAIDRDGNEFTYTGTELMGRCICHENDHLDGILYIDKAELVLDDDDEE
jgi:peptide deformylase